MDRSILLPEFMQNEAWLAYAKAIDDLFRDVDRKTRLLSRLREPLHLSFSAQQKVLTGRMLVQTELDHFDKEYLVRSLNLIGLPFNDTEIFTDDHLFRFLQSLASYWYQKGKGTVAEFLSFVLNSDLRIVNMWTTDYVDFYPEGDDAIQGSITEGGTWYPTTHIQLTYDPTFLLNVSIQDVIQMVYDIGNYNLVMHSIVAELSIPVAQDTDGVTSITDFVESKSIALGDVIIHEVFIPN